MDNTLQRALHLHWPGEEKGIPPPRCLLTLPTTRPCTIFNKLKPGLKTKTFNYGLADPKLSDNSNNLNQYFRVKKRARGPSCPTHKTNLAGRVIPRQIISASSSCLYVTILDTKGLIEGKHGKEQGQLVGGWVEVTLMLHSVYKFVPPSSPPPPPSVRSSSSGGKRPGPCCSWRGLPPWRRGRDRGRRTAGYHSSWRAPGGESRRDLEGEGGNEKENEK